MENLVDSGARIVLLAIGYPGPEVVLEYLYDLGIRRNDMIFMAIEWLSG